MKNTTKTTARPHYEANTQQEAWQIVNKIFPGDYEYNAEATSRCGYPVYTSTRANATYAHISDLNTRLEVCYDNGDCVNIWFTDLYWNAVENESLKKEIAKKDAKIEELKNTVDLKTIAYDNLLKDWVKQIDEIKALKAELKALKENGYSLLDELIA